MPRLIRRFAEPWKAKAGELKLNAAFVEADTEAMDSPADSLTNALILSLDELTRGLILLYRWRSQKWIEAAQKRRTILARENV